MHRRLVLTSLTLLVTASLAPLGPVTGKERERKLFNGKDLTGWDGEPGYWSVRDGAITGINTAEKPLKQNSFLIWRGGTLKDFDLRVKFRIEGKGANSGIQYRSKDLGGWVVSGYQADIDEPGEYTGMFYEERGRRFLGPVGDRTVVGPDGKGRKVGSVGDRAKILARVKKGDWNQYRITARGNRIVQAINGRVTTDAVDEDLERRAMEGILAFQLHSGPPMTVQFKDVKLVEWR